jgi:putative NIF3 family GTP cyclohydrolase 1 type 2
MIKAMDIHEHFRKVGNWVNWERTTDTFKAGDPQRPVRTVAVAWKPTWDALKEAHSKGADLFVGHESICVNAVNGSPEPEVVFSLDSEKPKFDWLAESGMVAYRCHDVWDRFPEIGIRWAWQRGLELGGEIAVDQYPYLVTQVEPLTLGDLARHVLARIRPLGQNGVLVTGDLERPVSRVATGTGAIDDPLEMVKLGADVALIVDDYYRHVREGVHVRELGFATITVNHGVAEEWGIRNLATYLGQAFPELDVFHIPQQCPYTVIAAEPDLGSGARTEYPES